QHVDPHDPVEIGQVVVEQSAQRARYPGVVHHDVQAAEFLDGGSHHGPDLFGVGDVRPAEQCGGAQPGGQLLSPVGLDVGDDDPGPLVHKAFHDSATDAGGPTGDDGDLAVQFVDHTTS